MAFHLRVIDSITELQAVQEQCVAISGSHGGSSSARYAIAARPWLSVFNDAGVGLDDAGVAALGLLQSHSLAACTVAHHSARIGEGRSTLLTGLISHVNLAALRLGLHTGTPLREALAALDIPIPEDLLRGASPAVNSEQS